MSSTRSITLALIAVAAPSIVVAQPAPAAPAAPAAPPAPPAPAAQPAPAAPAPSLTAASSSDGEPAWTLGISPRIGATVPTSKLGAMVIGGFEIDYATAVANHQLVLSAGITLTRPTHDVTVMDSRVPGGAAMSSIAQVEVVAGVMASYRVFPAGHRVVPWVGAGPILHLLKTTETSSLAPGDNTATSTELGAELGGGVDYRMGPGFVAGDLRVVYSTLDNLLTGASNAGNIALTFGYRFVF